MAIGLIYMNFLVPVKTIKEKYPGGWEQCLKDHKQEIERGRVWYDEHLFHDGAMDQRMIDGYIASWEKRGFQIATEVDGHTQWADMCCIEYLGHHIPEWLELTDNGCIAYLAGAEPGEIVRPGWMKKLIEKRRQKDDQRTVPVVIAVPTSNRQLPQHNHVLSRKLLIGYVLFGLGFSALRILQKVQKTAVSKHM